MSLLISVLVPCYNEEGVVRTTHDRLKSVLQRCGPDSYEIVFVDDGSTDGTKQALREIAGSDPHVRVIGFSRNFGHQAAISAAINACSGDVAVIFDADLQDPPELIPDMVALHRSSGSNVVYGVRRSRLGESLFKRVSARAFYRFLNYMTDVSLPVDTGDFRLIDRKVMDAFRRFREKNKYVRGVIGWMGFKQTPIAYDRQPRLAGETKYTLPKMLRLASVAMFYFSKKPLKLSLKIGVLSIFVGMALTIWVFMHILLHWGVVPGWASTVIVVIFFSGAQLVTVGVLGEYIGSILDEVKDRPEYIVSEVINGSDK